MAKVTLKMKFKTDSGSTSTISVNNCKEEITNTEQKNLMDKIIESDIFITKSGSLIEKVSSEIIKVTKEEFDLA